MVRCHFLPRARTKESFLNQWLELSLPPKTPAVAGRSSPGEVTSSWSLRADPCLIPSKAKSVGQPALSCSSHNCYSKPPLWGGTLQKIGNSIRAGAVCQTTRPLVSNPNSSSKSGEETQQHGRKILSIKEKF